MPSQNYIDFVPSFLSSPAGAQRLSDVPRDEIIEVSVYLKRRPDTGSGDQVLPAEDPRAALHARRTVQHQDDISLLRTFAAESGLTVSAVDAGRLLIKLSGSAFKMEAAFGTTLGIYRDSQHEFRGRSGILRLPQDVHAVVEAVLGLDTRLAAQPHFVLVSGASDPAVVTLHRPNQLGVMYGFPTGVTGAGQCIGILEFGRGFLASDNTAAFGTMGLATRQVVAISVDGAQNMPGVDAKSDTEVALDIQVAGAVAPGARLAVYFAPNTRPRLC